VRSGAGDGHADAAVTHRLVSHQFITIIRPLIRDGDRECRVRFTFCSKPSQKTSPDLISAAQFSIKCRKTAPALPIGPSFKPGFQKGFCLFLNRY
jgi:hypothetical protein